MTYSMASTVRETEAALLRYGSRLGLTMLSRPLASFRLEQGINSAPKWNQVCCHDRFYRMNFISNLEVQSLMTSPIRSYRIFSINLICFFYIQIWWPVYDTI